MKNCKLGGILSIKGYYFIVQHCFSAHLFCQISLKHLRLTLYLDPPGLSHAQLVRWIVYLCFWYPGPMWWVLSCRDLGINSRWVPSANTPTLCSSWPTVWLGRSLIEHYSGPMAECIGLLLTHLRWAVLWKSESADRCAANAGSQSERHLFKLSLATAEVA